jgi:signal transduction histidine kinase/CheY-like chemotaxis protein
MRIITRRRKIKLRLLGNQQFLGQQNCWSQTEQGIVARNHIVSSDQIDAAQRPSYRFNRGQISEALTGAVYQLSPRVVSSALVAISALCVLLTELGLLGSNRFVLLTTTLVLNLAAAAVWLVNEWRQCAGRWFALTSVVVLANGGLIGSGPALLILLPLLPLLAAALLGLNAAHWTAVLQTLLLFLLVITRTIPVAMVEVLLAILTVWLTSGLITALDRPLAQITTWSWQHFQRAQQLLEEARNRQGELAQALDDLAHANRQLTLLNDKLAGLRLLAEEAQNAKSLFVAKVSHELRTPLNIIISLIDLLVETPEVYGDELPPPLLEDLRIVHRNCEYLSNMITDVLDLSQAEAGQLSLHRSRVELAGALASAIDVVAPLVEKKQLALHLDLPDDLPPVYCDPQRTRQVILNLVSNAARFTERGSIALAAACAGNGVTVSVADTGAGISPEHARQIFEPFFQGGDRSRAQSGYGLGLSISQKIVELQNGRMWFESTPGVGSTFYFTLPVAPAEAAPARPEQWISEEWHWHERPWRRLAPAPQLQERVVVCDAGGELPALLAHCSDEVEFVGANTVAQAVAELTECPAHLLIINSPTPQQGAAWAEAARQGAPDTPIVACSFQPQLQHPLCARAAGYLVKPVLIHDLQRVLHGLGRPLRRVLLVDDDPDFRRLVVRMLSTFDDPVAVIVATNGSEALAALQTHPPDLILLDVMLPDMLGWEVLARKNQDEALRAVPAIMLSAQDPAEQPRTSPVLHATFGGGFSVNKLLYAALELAALLSKPEPTPGRAPG